MIDSTFTVCAPYGTPEEMAKPWPKDKVEELHTVLNDIFNISQPNQDTVLN